MELLVQGIAYFGKEGAGGATRALERARLKVLRPVVV